jgi:hypothetical protein
MPDFYPPSVKLNLDRQVANMSFHLLPFQSVPASLDPGPETARKSGEFLYGSARKQIEPPVAAPSRGVNLGREGSGFVHRIFSRLPYGDARQWPYAHWCF